MQNNKDDGRTKHNTDSMQFSKSRQSPGSGQDVPLIDGYQPQRKTDNNADKLNGAVKGPRDGVEHSGGTGRR